MRAFLYGAALQWRLDIRSKSLLITCYLVPLLFFVLMGGIFTSLTPDVTQTLIPSMTVMGVSMGALIGLPPTLSETYGSEIKKIYKAGGVPLAFGIFSMALSAFVHLLFMSIVILLAAPVLFDAKLPENLLGYGASLALFILTSLGVGCVLGLSVKRQDKLTMLSQLVFLPSILLSGILFPKELLPRGLEMLGLLFPASWGYRLMAPGGSALDIVPLLAVLMIAAAACGLCLKFHE